jgi:hypothetical protein
MIKIVFPGEPYNPMRPESTEATVVRVISGCFEKCNGCACINASVEEQNPYDDNNSITMFNDPLIEQ